MKKNNEYLELKGCRGSVEVNLTDNILYGSVLDIKDGVVYQGKTLEELKEDFKEPVNNYILHFEKR